MGSSASGSTASPVSAATSAGTNSASGGRPAGAETPGHDIGDGGRHAVDQRADRRVPGEGLAHQRGEATNVVARLARRVGAELEVGQVGGAGIVEQHALRDEPAVHDPLLGRGSERGADPSRQRRDLGAGHRAAVQAIAQRPAPHPPHDQVRRSRLPPVVVDRDDRLVAQRRHPLGAGLERPHELRAIRDLLTHDADRKVTLDPRQPGGVNGPIAPGAEALAQPVAPQRETRRLGQLEGRVVREDPPVEVDKLRRGVESQLLGEHLAVLAGRRAGHPPGDRCGRGRA